ncbi:MAG: ATP-dependent DNA helicase [Euryarchaeota archaeon]|jgi:Rad3-related DNA helicase|nr:ATP-dependent DNA helicase [Euryarchaeota archaeon]MBT3653876.1 ATP-dependent DNA helicase [Euryarchaeota archaeon]MBT3757280.1 ATP-dependent DNA helicase [Euryarchaeota archaeon]MBT4050743.1 ATP-dependent DNA helicase [Euryarchaeota archaeon]MBT4346338.1 ATP-dependent DNA helicase [Euryarchaeota archaeon]|tara:strand:- start:3859 stop:5901 length:2043 start_codon:yes stop_codon:yes gene_type:complete
MTGPLSERTGGFVAHEHLRDSQKEMILDGIQVLSDDGFLLAAAPTGIGKTAAALASVLEISRNSSERLQIMFLTGRQSQHRIVIETIRLINSRLSEGVSHVKVVDIIGRESMCEYVDRVTGKCNCEEDVIEGSRVERREELREMILTYPTHVDDVISRSRQRKMCAWASARSAVKSCDLIVCDYNHVFVENVRTNSLAPMGIDLENVILIIDEAHNLPDRIRNGLERRATMSIFRDSKIELEEFLGEKEKEAKQLDLDTDQGSLNIEGIRIAKRQMDRLMREMRKWYAAKQRELELSKKDDLRISTREFIDEINHILMESIEADRSNNFKMLKSLIQQLFRVRVEQDDSIADNEKEIASNRLASMLNICLQFIDNPALVLVFDILGEDGRVRSFLLDPGVVSSEIFEETKGSILMSGTLFPPAMYADLLQIPNDRPSITKEYSSPFLGDRRPVLVAKDVTTKYTDRGLVNTNRIRDHIEAVVTETPGHVALFAPSYAMLREIAGEDWSWLPGFGIQVIEETQRMSKRRVNGVVDKLEIRRRAGSRVLLAGVLSGKLAEGVDYPNNILDAVICVGLPLPPPSARQDALKNYYTQRYDSNRAWRYTSFQPAVNSLMQALGRPIRKAEDRAIVVLLEKRLFQRQYRNCLPNDMALMESPDNNRTKRHTRSFFKRLPKPAIEKE